MNPTSTVGAIRARRRAVSGPLRDLADRVEAGGFDGAHLAALADAVELVEADWAAIKRETDEQHATELAVARNYRPAPQVPPERPTLSAEEVDKLLGKLDDDEARRKTRAIRRGSTWAEASRNALRQRGPRYALAALEGEARTVASAPVGERSATLNRSSWTLGRLVSEGLLEPGDVERVLVDAASGAGLPEREARSTIRGALRRRGTT